MREILFRAKTIENEQWVEGYFVHVPCGRFLSEEYLIQTIKDDGRIGQLHTVYEITVGQFIGLTDKNGKKIFEGDIMSERGHLFVVVYDTKWARFRLQHIGRGIQYPEWNRGEQMEIVGNIHDNPELLEG